MRNTLSIIATLACALPASAQRYTFSPVEAAEYVAEIEMASPGSDWAQRGREAAVANVSLDGKHEQQVILFAGDKLHTYSVFLGKVTPGDHELSVEKSEAYSAPQSGLAVRSVAFKPVRSEAFAWAPVLFARSNTIGKFSDVPLLLVCERLPGNTLQYSVVFSNEDGGTSTRALMARWGRTTDIEWIYRIQLGSDGKPVSETIQGRDHKELPFEGERFGTHPMLIPVTQNNMVSGEAQSPLRFQLAPVLVDVSERSRESLMDEYPVTYQVMSKELARESKLRQFGVAAGDKISDPRHYLFIDYKASAASAGISVRVRLHSDTIERSSSLGRGDYLIGRGGWVRTTVELPPDTKAGDIREVAFDCLVSPPEEKGDPWPHSGTCGIEAVRSVFLLNQDYTPGPNLWRRVSTKANLRTGESAAFTTW